MVLRAKCVIFVAALCTILNIGQCGDGDDDSSDDDDPIREALLLIKLIKRAGAAASLPQVTMSDLLSPDAPNTPLSVSSFNTIQPDQHYRRRMLEDENAAKPRAKAKHRSALYRRQDYEDMFGPQPAATTTKGSPTVKNDSPELASSATAAANPIDQDSAKVAATDNKPQADTSVNQQINGQTQQTNGQTNAAPAGKPVKARGVESKITKEKLKSKVTKKDATQNSTKPAKNKAKDLIMSQVANELENEMKSMQKSDKNKAAKALSNFTKHKHKTKTTLRIHLDGSTRYPIPYPENHALCYTDPLNGLCKTPI